MRINSIGNLVFVLLLHVFYPLPTWVAPLGVESRTRAPRTLSNLQQAFPTYFTIQHRFASQLGSYSTVNCLRLPTWTLSFMWLRHPTGLNTAVFVSPGSLPIVYTLFTSHQFGKIFYVYYILSLWILPIRILSNTEHSFYNCNQPTWNSN